MSIHARRQAIGLALTLALSLPLTSFAQADGEATAEKTQGDTRYRSGGIGADDSAALKALRGGYVLDLTFSSPAEGHSVWESGVAVVITDAKGYDVLSLKDAGPILLAALPPGTYQVTATLRGATVNRTVTLAGGKHQTVAMQFPADAKAAH